MAVCTNIPEVQKTEGRGSAIDYSIRLAPYNIARIKVERLARDRSYIHWVFVPPAYRGLGLGQILMNRVLQDADREGVSISLVAKACGTMGQAPLEEWYATNGFVRRGPAEEGGIKMVRPPSARASSRRHKRVA